MEHMFFEWWGNGPLSALFGIAMGIAWLAFWIIVVVVVVGLLKRGRSDHLPASSAVSVLEERYARGEITREEFLERRAVLMREQT